MPEPAQPLSYDQEDILHIEAGGFVSINLGGETIEIHAAGEKGADIRIKTKQVENLPPKPVPILTGRRAKRAAFWQRLTERKEINFDKRFHWLLAVLCLVLYLSTRLIGLREYPMYFFTDEAVQTLLAEDLVRDDFHDTNGVLLPAFFYNGYQYNLGTSVYLQVIPFLLFGRVLEVNRGVSVLATSLSAVFLFLIAMRIFRMKYPWLLILLLSITPVWFLHSRTSFETGLAFTFYCGFIYYYLAYRQGERNHLYGAVVMAALTFYSYSPVRLVVLASALLFFIVDFRYHIQDKKVLWCAVALTVLVILPFISFEIDYPGENLSHLHILGSYWVQDISIFEKISHYLVEYGRSFSPNYWFFSQTDELVRHRMGPHAYMNTWLLPFVVGGMALAIKRWKDAPYRVVLLIFLLAPMGGAIVERGITRILIMVIPMLLFAGFAIEWLLQFVRRRFRVPDLLISVLLLILLGWFNIYLLQDALTNGPTWSTDYAMSGMQYGAVQLSEKIPEFIANQDKPVKIILTPTWANGTDIVMRFFFGTPLPFEIGSVDTFINAYTPLEDNVVMILTPQEMKRLEENEKFTDINVLDQIPYPDGNTGFYFVKFRYVDNIQEVFQAEADARKILQKETLDINGISAEVSYSYLDMGPINLIFDQDVDTMARTMEANPFVVKIEYSQTVNLQSCTALIGGTPTDVYLELYDDQEELLGQYHQQYDATPNPRTVDLAILPQNGVSEVVFKIKNSNDGEPAHVHLWEATCTRQAE
jgi:hypothetical protein